MIESPSYCISHRPEGNPRQTGAFSNANNANNANNNQSSDWGGSLSHAGPYGSQDHPTYITSTIRPKVVS
ncbi:hypothetical protein CFIMG_007942RA00001 [Ceratocystis fimbriata CBS 114723]|uniref:Uncharacterized protein n=1 Tax=Ceratocystis fimbriata CBS 114723 TaxID=1035309 RepID=A0A2C5X016_9PEZI|nr:hypothetical protein CFIMG_007942RA00001 [Ceratocystis fimbriata CBS 114723]